MLDTAMLGFLSSDTEVGYYTASTKLGHMVLSMLTAITGVLLPRLTNYVQKKDSGSFKELINKTACILILLSVPMTAGIILLSKPLIILLSGEQYLPAVPAMKTLSLLLILMSFGSLVGVQILPAINKEKVSFNSYIVGAISNIVLNSLLIPKFGALGAAIGSIFAEGSVTFIQLLYAKQYILNKDFFRTIIKSVLSTFTMSVAILVILKFVSNILFQLSISFVAGIIIYSFMLICQKDKYFIYYTSKISKKLRK